MWFDGTDDEDEEDYVDPASELVGLDANALDRKGGRDDTIDRFLALVRSGRLRCRIGHGVACEILRASNAAPASAATQRAERQDGPARALTASDHLARIRVRAILCGNAKPGKHDADARHLSEAAEAGCGFFVTHDGRMLRKRDDLQAIALRGLRIVTLDEFMALIDRHDRALGDDRPS